jgi:hypothetical protein
VTQTLTGRSIASGGPVLDFARQVVDRLDSVLREDGRAQSLATCVDSPFDWRSFASEERGFVSSTHSAAERWPTPQCVAGLTPWQPGLSMKQVLTSAGVLHGAANKGSVIVPLSEQPSISADELTELLAFGWRQTNLVRIRFLRQVPMQPQLMSD